MAETNEFNLLFEMISPLSEERKKGRRGQIETVTMMAARFRAERKRREKHIENSIRTMPSFVVITTNYGVFLRTLGIKRS